CSDSLAYTISRFYTFLYGHRTPQDPHSFPTRRSSDLTDSADPAIKNRARAFVKNLSQTQLDYLLNKGQRLSNDQKESMRKTYFRSEEHTSELQSRENLVCRLLLEKKKENKMIDIRHTK